MQDGAPANADPKTAAAGEFQCQACGGRMAYDAAQGRMLCGFCGATRGVGEGDEARTIVEYDLEHGLGMAAKRGYGTAVRRVGCAQCGAVVSYGENETARGCDFCGSPQVAARDDSQLPIRPESVLPFRVDKKAATAKFASWLGTLWLRPSDLQKLAAVSEMTGMYVPYWAFDAKVHSDWTAFAGYYYYVTETYMTTDDKGRSVQRQRQVQKVRWEPAWGSRNDEYDDLLVCGSRGLSAAMTQQLEPFDTGALVAYDPSYLAGWRAEEYSVDLNAGWQGAVQRMEDGQRARCSGDVPGDTQRALHVTNRFADEKFKHILLPIWISVYRYKDKPFQFLVNGQTGEVTGHAPWSVVKITLLCLALAVLAVVVIASQR
jgi:Zn finger protein HypA/HybF involved in hydrogenase expression